MSDDGDPDESTMVLRMRPETHVYTNPHGDVVICQKRWPDEDVFVYIEIKDVAAIVTRMMELVAEVESAC
jgi:hypothetical protein